MVEPRGLVSFSELDMLAGPSGCIWRACTVAFEAEVFFHCSTVLCELPSTVGSRVNLRNDLFCRLLGFLFD